MKMRVPCSYRMLSCVRQSSTMIQKQQKKQVGIQCVLASDWSTWPKLKVASFHPSYLKKWQIIAKKIKIISSWWNHPRNITKKLMSGKEKNSSSSASPMFKVQYLGMWKNTEASALRLPGRSTSHRLFAHGAAGVTRKKRWISMARIIPQ